MYQSILTNQSDREYLEIAPSETEICRELDQYISNYQALIESDNNSSKLTGSGYPLEISFVTNSNSQRYTIDPFCASHSTSDRLSASMALLESSFGVNISNLDRSRLLNWQRGISQTDLKYGAWIGLREKDEVIQTKLYVEANNSSAEIEWARFFKALPFDAYLRMVGYSPDSGDVELYFRSNKFKPIMLGAALAPLGKTDNTQQFITCLERQYGRKFSDRFPGGVVGASYVVNRNFQVTAFSLFLNCRSYLGRDRHIRNHFSKLIEQNNVDSDYYLSVTQESISNDTALTQHGLLALTITAKNDYVFGIGYCPHSGVGL